MKFDKNSEEKQCWLLVERLENWKVDRDSGFLVLGIGERKKATAEKMKPGDLIITYVSSGRSCFVDIRTVTGSGVRRSKRGLIYDDVYPYEIDTSPLKILPEEKWIKVHTLVGKLSFLDPCKDWRQVMRNAIRQLDGKDSKILLNALSQ